MAKSNQQAEILKLGKIIIKELSEEDNGRLTLLEKWMGHYIAKLINRVEHVKDEEEKKSLQKECYETILNLWDKRSSLPTERMPLGRIKPAIDILNELRRQKDIWERWFSPNSTSWESLAAYIYETQCDAIKVCIQAAIEECAIDREKIWVNECSEFISEEEKEIVENLDYFLKEPMSILDPVYDDSPESKETEKSKIEIALDMLETITDNQKKVIQKLRTELIKNSMSR